MMALHTHETKQSEQETHDIHLLTEEILQKYGYDFRDYAEASFKRRIQRVLPKYECENVNSLIQKLRTEPDFFSLLLNDLTITVTEMFRDPHVYKAVVENVFSYLKTYPEIKIWCAGCAGGEEVYSLAILLKEYGLYDRTILYGTDINPAALKRAKEGILNAGPMKEATRQYYLAGGRMSLNNYYNANYGRVLLDPSLRERTVFSDHNLVSDGVFGEMQLIFCRNALIYFKRELTDRAIGLFGESLCPGGFLCLGSKESLSASKYKKDFDAFLRPQKIYRKKISHGHI